MTSKTNAVSPIGIFDSGIGGMTVAKQIIQQLPNENFIYFGDIARLPYGTKSVTTIQNFAKQTAGFLLEHNVKALVIACNTLSAVAKTTVEELAVNIPVIDVLSAGSQASIAATQNNQIGVIATPATINSHAYTHAIQAINSNIKVFEQSCPLFVPFIEEGYIQHKALELIAQEYLAKFISTDIDTLILGCTHYPIISDTIKRLVAKHIQLIDPAVYTTSILTATLDKLQLLNNSNITPQYKFYVTELSPNFNKIAAMFIGTEFQHPTVVTLE